MSAEVISQYVDLRQNQNLTLAGLVSSWAESGQVDDQLVRTALFGILGEREDTVYRDFINYLKSEGFNLDEDRWKYSPLTKQPRY